MTIYQPGQRIALVCTADPHTALRPGDTGTVGRHDQAQHTVFIAWDTGSSLSMCLDAGDQIRLLPAAPDPTDEPAHAWTVPLQHLRTRGAQAGRHVAGLGRPDSQCLPAATARTFLKQLATGIDTRDPALLDLLPSFTPPPRWRDRDTAEIRYTEAVTDSVETGPPAPRRRGGPR